MNRLPEDSNSGAVTEVATRRSTKAEVQAADKILDILEAMPVVSAHRCFLLVQGHHQERVAIAQQGQGR